MIHPFGDVICVLVLLIFASMNHTNSCSIVGFLALRYIIMYKVLVENLTLIYLVDGFK